MKFSAVVNCYNEEDFIYYALSSIYDLVDEIIVVDNASTDLTVKVLTRFISDKDPINKVRLFCLEQPMQLADARNYALLKASYDWVVKWDGDFCAFSSSDKLSDNCAPLSNLLDFVRETSDKFDLYLLYSINICGDIYHYDSTRHYLGLSGDSFVGRKDCMRYGVNEKYGDVGFLRRPDGSAPRFCYMNKPDLNKMYFVHIYGVKSDDYLLYRRFLSEYQVWLVSNEYVEFWDWMRRFKAYDKEGGVRYVRKQLLEHMVKHNIILPSILKPVIDFPKYKIIYKDGKPVDREVFCAEATNNRS